VEAEEASALEARTTSILVWMAVAEVEAEPMSPTPLDLEFPQGAPAQGLVAVAEQVAQAQQHHSRTLAEEVVLETLAEMPPQQFPVVAEMEFF
jgi:hypothetical protein